MYMYCNWYCDLLPIMIPLPLWCPGPPAEGPGGREGCARTVGHSRRPRGGPGGAYKLGRRKGRINDKAPTYYTMPQEKQLKQSPQRLKRAPPDKTKAKHIRQRPKLLNKSNDYYSQPRTLAIRHNFQCSTNM